MHQRNERSFITRMNVHFDRYTQLPLLQTSYFGINCLSPFADSNFKRPTSLPNKATAHHHVGFQIT